MQRHKLLLLLRQVAFIGVSLIMSPLALSTTDISGSARVSAGTVTTENGAETEQDQLNQTYTLAVSHPLAPFVRLDLDYRYQRFDTDTDNLEFERKNSVPSARLTYGRPNFQSYFLYSERRNRSTNPVQDLDTKSQQIVMSWLPSWGAVFSASWLHDENTSTNVAVFGRDVESDVLNADIVYQRTRWGTTYRYSNIQVENNQSRVELDQTRHELQGYFSDRYWDDRISWTFDGLVIDQDQDQKNPQGGTIGSPVRAQRGLYVLDSNPDLGNLAAAPDLIDGDTTTPARESAVPGAPTIQIGGANTDRNIGLDLGVTRPATRLLIDVSALSGPAVMWEVWHSSDNLNWTQVSGVSSRFDQPFLRYEVTFPETTDRYFKAVNVSTNSQPNVAVTELRAFVDVTDITRSSSDLYRVSSTVTITPYERFTAIFDFFYDNEQALVAGLAGREGRIYNYEARLLFDLADDLLLDVGYRYSDLEEKKDPKLYRTEDRYYANLDWAPLPTFRTRFAASRRIEQDRGILLREVDTLRASSRARLLPVLGLTSELIYNDIDDPFSGFKQKSWRTVQSMDGRVTRELTLTGGIDATKFDITGNADVEQRLVYSLASRWRPVPHLSFAGNWSRRDEERQSGDIEQVNQRYNLAWSPGRKLSMSFHWQDLDANVGADVRTYGAGMSYRLRRRATVFASATRSKTDRQAGPASKVENVNFGINLTF